MFACSHTNRVRVRKNTSSAAAYGFAPQNTVFFCHLPPFAFKIVVVLPITCKRHFCRLLAMLLYNFLFASSLFNFQGARRERSSRRRSLRRLRLRFRYAKHSLLPASICLMWLLKDLFRFPPGFPRVCRITLSGFASPRIVCRFNLLVGSM